MTIVVVMVPLVTHLLQTLPRISDHTRMSIREPHHSLCYHLAHLGYGPAWWTHPLHLC